jgi:phenylacetate-CoA ligase
MGIHTLRSWIGWWSSPSADPGEIRRYQERQLRSLVAHAFNRVPYYRRVFEQAGLKPEHIRSVTDLRLVPATTKRNLQQVSLEDRLARGVNVARCVRSTTSGSTGEPVVVLRSRSERFALQACRLRAQILSGLRRTDRRVFLRGNPSVHPRLHHRVRLFEQIEVDSCLDGLEILTHLRRLQPDVLRGQPQTLDRLAQLRSHGDFQGVRPRLIFSGADMLTPAIRNRICTAFGSKLVDFYGTDEFDLLAWECRQCGQYHTCDDSAIIEIVADGRPAESGEEGRIFVTGLHSFAMPFLRLDLGDLARRPASVTACSIHFGSIEQPLGRTRDFLPLPGGGWLSPSRVELNLRDIPGLARYQVVQIALDRIIVYYEPLPEAPANLVRRIEEQCKEIFPPGLAVEICPASDSLSGSNKRRIIRGYEQQQ